VTRRFDVVTDWIGITLFLLAIGLLSLADLRRATRRGPLRRWPRGRWPQYLGVLTAAGAVAVTAARFKAAA
jgi:hypothetical protein